MSFLYSLPTTGAIKLTALVSDPRNAHAADLARANAARGRVRTALKEVRRADAANKDWPGCISALQEYLPHLLAIIHCTQTDELILKGEPVFEWRSTLSASANKTGAGRVRMVSLHYELCFVLLSYALALCNSATYIVQSVGQYERDASTSDADRKSGDEKINSAADTLCKAAGLLKYLSQTVIPQWEASSLDLRARPPDLTREGTDALSNLCMADAEKLAIRRLMSKSIMVAQATITPGPPLPRSHPSPSLLSKLYMNVNTLYESARALGKTVGTQQPNGAQRILSTIKRDKPAMPGSLVRSDSSGSAEQSDGISQELRTYLSDGRAFSSSLAYKWLGVDAGENGGNSKIGDALGWLTLAKSGLSSLQGRSKSILSIKKGKVERAKRKDRILEELDDIEGFIKAYKRINDTVLFQPIPSESHLLTRVPAGRSVLAIKPFTNPPIAFGQRKGEAGASVSQLSDHMVASMRVTGDEADEGGDSDDSEVDQPVQQSNYF